MDSYTDRSLPSCDRAGIGPEALFRPLLQLFERIEDFKSRTPEVPVIASGDCQPVPPGGGRNITVFDGHSMPNLVEESLLVSPHVRNSYIEAVDSTLECVHKPSEPRLKSSTLRSVFCAYPISQLRNDDCAGVTAVPFLLEPSDHARVAVALGRLTDDVRVEQPAHNRRRRGGAVRRGGTSSGLTGQALSTVSQSSLPASRRNTSTSSSASKCASK
jgi:hypothetical protein